MIEPDRLVRTFKKAIPLILIAAVFLSLQALFVKLVSPSVNLNIIVMSRGIVCVISVLFMGLLNPSVESLSELYKTKHLGKHLVRGLSATCAAYGFYIALKMISLANATVLFLTMPIFVPIVTRVYLKIKIPSKMWIGLSIAFVGILIILKPDAGIINIGAIIGLMSGIFGAVAVVWIRRLHRVGEPSFRIMAYSFTPLMVVGFILACMTAQTYTIELTGNTVFYLVMVGLMSLGYQTCLIYSGKHAPMRMIMPLLYLTTIITTILDYYIWHDYLTWGSFLGIIIIIIGTVLKVLLFPKHDVIMTKKSSDIDLS